MLHLIGTIIIGFLAGVVAKLLTPGRDPGGFIITTILGIVGAFVATYLGQAVGWYRADEGAGFIGAVVGAIILLAIYHRLVQLFEHGIRDTCSRDWISLSVHYGVLGRPERKIRFGLNLG
jgi:uncharacterized membrane protein YeaQ/YmgE (transglycosylase-associated protein family)